LSRDEDYLKSWKKYQSLKVKVISKRDFGKGIILSCKILTKFYRKEMEALLWKDDFPYMPDKGDELKVSGNFSVYKRKSQFKVKNMEIIKKDFSNIEKVSLETIRNHIKNLVLVEAEIKNVKIGRYTVDVLLKSAAKKNIKLEIDRKDYLKINNNALISAGNRIKFIGVVISPTQLKLYFPLRTILTAKEGK
jgi:hypothetical protein